MEALKFNGKLLLDFIHNFYICSPSTSQIKTWSENINDNIQRDGVAANLIKKNKGTVGEVSSRNMRIYSLELANTSISTKSQDRGLILKRGLESPQYRSKNCGHSVPRCVDQEQELLHHESDLYCTRA